ncbi:MAG TPA: CPBP family intramembrane glutamic endopeptidase [Polaromonas sp.]|uniref:CPBP family intramembrane glutamic endopeptidase n=1 Tax=Polaromonas sp. TaxID=1869339 RepID=UPI002D4DA523|nr:CPBP family intramembrane glutamic endopeptidase [Polaromonas sp.]HYW57577.1 CPBP family intramembrane glutamic endopeptidase [Polaromonas sp.]
MAASFPFMALSLANHFYKPWLFQLAPTWFWVADFAQFFVAPMVGWYFFLRPTGVRMQDCGLPLGSKESARRDGIGFTLFVAALLVAAYWPMHVVTKVWFSQFNSNFQDVQGMPASYFPKLLVAFYMSATAALVEEVIWRGLGWMYLSAVLPLRHRRVGYVLITAIVFSIAHSEQGVGGVISAFWFGLLAAGIYVKLRTLWPIVLGHFIADMLIFGPWG